MRKIVLSLSLLLLVRGLYAQSSPEEKKERETIQHAKTLLVSTLDSSLPKVSLEYFLKYESAGAAIHWETNDCGEQTGDPEIDKGRGFPICVEADFDFEHRAITIFIAVGTADKGVSGAPALFSATITEPDGKVKSLRQLGELPKELHRPLPKSPRNVPDPAVRSGNSGVLTISSG